MSISPFRRTRLRAAAAALTLVLAGTLAAAAGCGSTEPTAVPIEQTSFNDTLHIRLADYTKLPSGMYVRDSIVGTGAPVAIGDSVIVRYVGSLPNGNVFDQNVVSGASAFGFRLGRGYVIPGWDIGIQGMNVGGRRRLIIPPELGYGSSSISQGGITVIPAYSVLVFTVDVVNDVK